MAHIIRDYQADVDSKWQEDVIKELNEAKEGRASAEKRAVEAEELGKQVGVKVERLNKKNGELIG